MTEQYIPKKVLALFAHPDDESFGPGGTIAKWIKSGSEVRIVCATIGDFEGMGEIRKEELCKAAEVLGVESVEFLSYSDGNICNCDLLDLEKLFLERIESFKPDTLITFNLNGLTGHLDHMAIASAATQAFRKSHIPQKLYYFNLLKEQTIHMRDYFIYFPEGVDPRHIDEIIDISDVWDIRLKAAQQHESQLEDMESFLQMASECGKREFFMVKNKEM